MHSSRYRRHSFSPGKMKIIIFFSTWFSLMFQSNAITVTRHTPIMCRDINLHNKFERKSILSSAQVYPIVIAQTGVTCVENQFSNCTTENLCQHENYYLSPVCGFLARIPWQSKRKKEETHWSFQRRIDENPISHCRFQWTANSAMQHCFVWKISADVIDSEVYVVHVVVCGKRTNILQCIKIIWKLLKI